MDEIIPWDEWVGVASFVKLPENVKKEKEIFLEADIKKLEKDGSETVKIILILIYTGMRISELFNLPLTAYHKTYVVGGKKRKLAGTGLFQFVQKDVDTLRILLICRKAP